MVKPYSGDLRERVVGFVHAEGLSFKKMRADQPDGAPADRGSP
jgi:hypothetical protein